MNDVIFPQWSMTEAVWKAVILSISVSLVILTVYCLSRGISTVFMHLYYIPIVLMAYRYHKRGVLYTGILGGIYVFFVYYYTHSNLIEGEAAVIRMAVFLCIAAVVALLSESLERQKLECTTVFESAEEGFMKVDMNRLAVVDANRRLCDMYGCKIDEVKEKPLERLWPDDATRAEFIGQLTGTGAVRGYESAILSKDGIRHDVIISAGMLPEQQAVFTLTDVSERKQAENRLRALMQQHESIIINANVCLMVLDPKGNVLIWNKAAEEVSGYRSDEVVGSNTIWRKIYPEKEYRKKNTGKRSPIISSISSGPTTSLKTSRPRSGAGTDR